MDISAITTELGAIATAGLAAGAIAAVAGVGLMAFKFGGKWAVRVFKSFTS
ncbi:hypothetical protein PXH66_08220 [Synoicihabitans lomoniglobus]|uniref:Uncharacterized protein n=1 Tax=Synoicihabitans lomoniglobus TaxID=2909285 RepID=A0AAF0CPW7_9BACT|nr:hypothetical protein PXH66_03310 [Opitutaceae bacterium LMO-M01]WED66833.1 hypothetical protein PXH66_08220 [Opitutaceae bacterium LMO-M01]